ncbi:Glycine receptor subunit alpha-1 [Armadillidium vulgare]|nr:Glycine receptor subunit alpha-1 [Armadillidium vulgare]
MDSSSSSFITRDGNASICFGNPYTPYSPYNVTIAGLIIQHELTQALQNDNCIGSLKNYELLDFGDQIWDSNNVTQLNLTITELCFDTFVIPFINQSGNYEEHAQICNNLGGRLLHLEEILYFQNYFLSFFSDIESRSILAANQITKSHFWLYDESTLNDSMKIFCHSHYFPSKISKNTIIIQERFPCQVDADYGFCITPSETDFTYYGPLIKNERNFFLRKRDFSFVISGIYGSEIKLRDDKWVWSFWHKEFRELKSTLPVGRKVWVSEKTATKNLFTFTHCKDYEFECSNGSCLPWNVRCNGLIDCFDESDEKNCFNIVKQKDYSVHVPPPPKINGEPFNIYYEINLLNIDEITSERRFLKIESAIILSWHDPKIEFWNVYRNENINMTDIWTPQIILVGNAYQGSKIELENKKIFKSCKSDPEFNETEDTRISSNEDPFMGTFIRGKDMKILFTFRAVMEIPCRFNIEKYPFGKQSCNVAFLIENAEYNSEFKYIQKEWEENNSDVIYNGSKDLGAYNFISANHEVGENGAVLLTIHLGNVYGYHVLTSFVPSVLTCIITYSTLFFPIKDFSNRVMVSMVALLVLAVLFTQASNSSVTTPYLKLLDIWQIFYESKY